MKAISLRHDSAIAWANCGWCELGLGRADAGHVAAARAIELDRDLADAWHCLGVCHRASGKLEDAVAALDTAACLEPHNWKVLANLGFTLQDLQRYGDSIDALRAAVRITTS